MWGLPRSGIKPVSPALAGGFVTAKQPGKPRDGFEMASKLKNKNPTESRARKKVWECPFCASIDVTMSCPKDAFASWEIP